MKFGKEFKTHLEETLPEWRDKFLCYKPLKKLLKHYPCSTADTMLFRPCFSVNEPAHADNSVDGGGQGSGSLIELQEWFVKILNEELEKFNDFYVDKEEDFVIRLQELKQRIEHLKEESSKNGVLASESEFSEEMMDIRKDLVTIHGQMVLLKNYSSLNFAGLVKILKKYDKRTGGLLRLPFMQLALHQPFFTTEPLTRLVRECEANLELLFPLQDEVIESVPEHSDLQLNNRADISNETSSSLGEETVDIYRSTLAAMNAIKGLQKASSTYDPVFSSFLKIQDAESTGAITAENSPSNSSPTSLKGEDVDQEDTNCIRSGG